MKQICNNCGLSYSKKCDCSLVEAPQTVGFIPIKPESAKFALVVTSLRPVALHDSDLTSANRDSLIAVPVGKPPYDLIIRSDEEIRFWAEKTIAWFYAKQTSSRLSLDGLMCYAEQFIPHRHTADGKKKVDKVRSILESYAR